jgi:hypothetical protein
MEISNNLERWPKSAIPKSVAYMIYAVHVLRVRVDWSSLGALNEKKFGVLKLHSLSVQFQNFHTLPFRSGSDEIPN